MRLQEALFVLTSALSLFGGGTLLVLCLRLRRTCHGEILVQQLALLGGADVAMAMWTCWLAVAALSGMEKMTWCPAYEWVQHCFMKLSLLFSINLVLGLAIKLRHRTTPTWLWYAPWFSAPMAVLLNWEYVVFRQGTFEDEHFVMLCQIDEDASDWTSFEVIAAFVIIASLHLSIIVRLRSAPSCVVRRSILSASRYIFAFLATYIVTVIYGIFETPTTRKAAGCPLEITRFASSLFVNLNGFFNFLAFRSHACSVGRQQDPRHRLSVGFQAALQETLEIPHGESIRKSIRLPTLLESGVDPEALACAAARRGGEDVATETGGAEDLSCSDGFVDE